MAAGDYPAYVPTVACNYSGTITGSNVWDTYQQAYNGLQWSTYLTAPAESTCLEDRMEKFDRVIVKDGYECEGCIGYYVGKSLDSSKKSVVDLGDCGVVTVLTDSLKLHPLTKEERIEQFINDYLYLEDIGALGFGSGINAAVIAALLYEIL